MNILDISHVLDGLNPRKVGFKYWLESLASPDADLRIGRAMPGMVKPGWRTQRGPDRSYRTHYLFFAPKASIRIDFETSEALVSPGTLLWFPPGVPYHLAVEPNSPVSDLYRFRFQVVNGEQSLTPFDTAQCIHPYAGYHDLFNQFDLEYRRALSARNQDEPLAYSDQRWRGLLLQLSSDVFRAIESPEKERGGLSARQCGAINQYVYAHIGAAISPADLAKVVGLSPVYFSKVFKQTYGIPPRKWLVEERVRHAADLLLEDRMNVNELSQHLGYANVHLFSRQFKAYHGIAPLGFRKSH